MDSDPLLSHYRDDERMSTLLDGLRAEGSCFFQIEGLLGSLPSLLVASVYEALRGGGCHLLVFPDEERLTHSKEELEAILPSVEWHLWLPKCSQELRASSLQRARAQLTFLDAHNASTAKSWVLVLASTLREMVDRSGRARRIGRSVEIGNEIDLEMICKEMEELGFRETDEVLDPGTYALRSGCIDVFSYASLRPIRLTLWGSELRRISYFDTETQLSVEELSSAHLRADPDYSVPYERQVPLIELLPKGSALWWMYGTSPEDLVDTSSSEERPLFEEALRASKQFRFGGASPTESVRRLAWESKPQPPLLDFEEIADHLIDQQRNGYALYLSHSNNLQATRLQEVLLSHQEALKISILPLSLYEGFVWTEAQVLCYTDHELMKRQRLPKVKVSQISSRFSLNKLQELQVGDFVVHFEYGIGRFTGLERSTHKDRRRELIRLVYRDNDLLYISIHALHQLSKYSSKDGAQPRLSKLRSKEWSTKKQHAKKHLQKTTEELIQMYARRKASQGYAYPSDSLSEAALVSSFPYEDTQDQAQATLDVFKDMSSDYPMDRLICGDVGFGKTEIAIRASYKALQATKQVAVLVPTTILALQHYHSFSARLQGFGVNVEHLHRFRSSKERRRILQDTESGKIDLLIGTSSLVSSQVRFKDLGLLITDEEQKFGVSAKERLKSRFPYIDALTLTATPIPRTLQFSLLGVRDVSIIATPPPRRQPIYTTLHRFKKSVIQEAIQMEMERKGQVFFVQNRVEAIEHQAELLSELVPEARIGIAHGQMNGSLLEKNMYDFVKGQYDILVCTNIIENGLDIPNANTIIIYNAHQFGLSELHQMRGRVGRSERKAFCYLITPSSDSLTIQAKQRLSTLEAFAGLGDGYKLALKDLDIRGSGNLLGAHQSGFMNELGFETYHKILDEALQELKSDELEIPLPPESRSSDPLPSAFETDLETYLPSSYISSPEVRMSYYKTLSNCKEEGIKSSRSGLEDRFGPLPEEAEALLKSCHLRLLATSCAFSKVTLKRNQLQCLFFPNSHPFGSPNYFSALLSFIQKYSQRCRLREIQENGCIEFNKVYSFHEAIAFLDQLLALNKKYTQIS